MKNKIKIIIGIFLTLIITIIVIAIINLFAQDRRVVLYNIDQLNSSLSETNIRSLEGMLFDSLREGESDISVKGLIRPSSYSENDIRGGKSYSFILDIDDYKATYRISFNLLDGEGFYETPTISCVSPDQMKYPQSRCTSAISFVSVSLGEFLPHRIFLDNDMDANVSAAYSETQGDYLKVSVSSCGDEKIEEEALKKTKDWVGSLGYDPSYFTIEVDGGCEVSWVKWKGGLNAN